MALIDEVKENFPQWGEWCTDDSGNPDETILQRHTDNALIKIQEYIPELTTDNITKQLTLHLVSIVKKYAFNEIHDDTEFENKPQILKDYEDTLEILEKYKEGEFSFETEDDVDEKADEGDIISMDARIRRFDTTFVDEDTPFYKE